MTWLELLIGFELDTGLRLPTAEAYTGEQPSQLEIRATVGRLTADFSRQVQQVVDTFFTADVAGLFAHGKPTTAKAAARLRVLGITGQWRTMSSCPRWNFQIRKKFLKPSKSNTTSRQKKAPSGKDPSSSNRNRLIETLPQGGKDPLALTTTPKPLEQPTSKAMQCKGTRYAAPYAKTSWFSLTNRLNWIGKRTPI